MERHHSHLGTADCLPWINDYDDDDADDEDDEIANDKNELNVFGNNDDDDDDNNSDTDLDSDSDDDDDDDDNRDGGFKDNDDDDDSDSDSDEDELESFLPGGSSHPRHSSSSSGGESATRTSASRTLDIDISAASLRPSTMGTGMLMLHELIFSKDNNEGQKDGIVFNTNTLSLDKSPSEGCKSVLRNLLHNSTAAEAMGVYHYSTKSFRHNGSTTLQDLYTFHHLLHDDNKIDLLELDTPIMNLSEREILNLAKKGKTSLFCSILRLFDQAETICTSNNDETDDDNDDKNAKKAEVSTIRVIQRCALAIRPHDIPAHMDAKEMVLSALSFLSSDIKGLTHTDFDGKKNKNKNDAETKNVEKVPLSSSSMDGGGNHDGVESSCSSDLVRQIFPCMPLIQQTEPEDSVESRVYTKNVTTPNGKWTMSNETFRRKILRLEKAFLSSTPVNTSRLRLCPRFEQSRKQEEIKLMRGGEKGSSSTSSPSKTGTKTKRKKSTSATTPSVTEKGGDGKKKTTSAKTKKTMVQSKGIKSKKRKQSELAEDD